MAAGEVQKCSAQVFNHSQLGDILQQEFLDSCRGNGQGQVILLYPSLETFEPFTDNSYFQSVWLDRYGDSGTNVEVLIILPASSIRPQALPGWLDVSPLHRIVDWLERLPDTTCQDRFRKLCDRVAVCLSPVAQMPSYAFGMYFNASNMRDLQGALDNWLLGKENSNLTSTWQMIIGSSIGEPLGEIRPEGQFRYDLLLQFTYTQDRCRHSPGNNSSGGQNNCRIQPCVAEEHIRVLADAYRRRVAPHVPLQSLGRPLGESIHISGMRSRSIRFHLFLCWAYLYLADEGEKWVVKPLTQEQERERTCRLRDRFRKVFGNDFQQMFPTRRLLAGG